MIKGKPSYPFHTIALAVSFSPGLEFLIRETKRLCDLHAAMAIFVHAGKKTGDKFRELSSVLSSARFHDGNSRIYWEQGVRLIPYFGFVSVKWLIYYWLERLIRADFGRR
ncbi:MAG: hypothetical protein IPP51_09485 [Bacteroidetes bacterium]|nr:hypothetical protein [Bacteroidota bacterium]